MSIPFQKIKLNPELKIRNYGLRMVSGLIVFLIVLIITSLKVNIIITTLVFLSLLFFGAALATMQNKVDGLNPNGSNWLMLEIVIIIIMTITSIVFFWKDQSVFAWFIANILLCFRIFPHFLFGLKS